jgi:RNA polymerase sigma-70 factor (sigma-E family)
MEQEPGGFAEFVSARSPALLRTAWLLTGDAQLAEDLLQSALARAWPHWSRIGDGQPEAYVRKIMLRMHAASSRRRWWRETPTEVLPERPSVDGHAAADDRAVLAAVLASLPVRQRQVVVLRYYDDLSVRDVAMALGCSVGTVKSQAHKGLNALRSALEERGELSRSFR